LAQEHTKVQEINNELSVLGEKMKVSVSNRDRQKKEIDDKKAQNRNTQDNLARIASELNTLFRDKNVFETKMRNQENQSHISIIYKKLYDKFNNVCKMHGLVRNIFRIKHKD